MPWTLGYRSHAIKDSDTEITLELKFDQVHLIDSIIILPATYTEDSHKLMSFGFPRRFHILNINDDLSQEIIVDYRNRDYPTPGIEPQIFNLKNKFKSRGILLKTNQLVKDATWWSEDHNFSLSEINVFSGNKNIALNCNVLASHHSTFSYIWNPKCLVDGFSLFSPVIRKSIHPLKYIFKTSSTSNLIFDNTSGQSIDELRIWPVIHSLQHNYPPSSGVGFPQNIVISSSNTLNFSSANTIYSSPSSMPKPGSNPLCIPIASTKERFLKFELSEPLIDHRTKGYRLALAEIECLNQGIRLKEGNWKKIQNKKYHDILYLNDGYSNEGKILPLKSSLIGLSKRAHLEKELEQINHQITFLDGQKNEKIRNIINLGLAIIIILFLCMVIMKFYTQKQWYHLRESIAADLHDEVGANLSSIAQYNELLKNSLDENLSEKQQQLFERAILTTRETSSQTRQLIRFLEQKRPLENIEKELHQLCEAILSPLPYTLNISEGHPLNHLKQQLHWNFIMFVKEALNNIRKHAQAHQCTINFFQQNNHWILEIKDDGIGFDFNGSIPHHLNSRAQKMGTPLSYHSQSGQGTHISITLQKKHFV